MTSEEFIKGWEALAAQPYKDAREYSFDRERQVVAREMYWQAFQHLSSDRWLAAITRWIRYESHFPSIPELREVLRMVASTDTATRKLKHEPTPSAANSTPPPELLEQLKHFQRQYGIQIPGLEGIG